jgi:hypothetical protein
MVNEREMVNCVQQKNKSSLQQHHRKQNIPPNRQEQHRKQIIPPNSQFRCLGAIAAAAASNLQPHIERALVCGEQERAALCERPAMTSSGG